MTYRFTLQLTRMECIHEQLNEWGKDEMRAFGFGISRKGQLFKTGYRNLGSYHEGDVNASGRVPQTWFEGDLEDDGLDVLLYLWLVEEDGGGVKDAAASLETQMFDAYNQEANRLLAVQFPRDCVPFTAFYKAILPMGDKIQEAATEGRNDEVYSPVDLLLRNEGPSSLRFDKDLIFERSKNLGHYRLTLHFSYEAAVDPNVGGFTGPRDFVIR